MSSNKAILTIDIGTTNIQGLVFKNSCFLQEYHYKINMLANNTQDAALILKVIDTFIEDAVKRYDVSDVALSTPMHTLIYLDENYNPIRKMMIWCDTRSSGSFRGLDEKSKLYLYKNTGTPLHSMSPLSKMLHHGTSGFYISDLKAYLLQNMTHNFVTDISNASATGIWNIKSNVWDPKILCWLGITTSQLPQVVEINRKFKHQKHGVNIMVGSSDGVLASRGIAKDCGDVIISFGTSVGVRKLSRNINIENGFCYNAGCGKWLIGHASNNGGNVVDWIRNELSENMNYDKINQIVLNTKYNDYCIPYIFGERGPFWVDGVECDLTGLQSNEEKIRALIYGVFANVSLMLEDIDTDNSTVYLTGGFFRNNVLRKEFIDFIERDAKYYPEDLSIHLGLLSLLGCRVGKKELVYEKHHKNPYLLKYKKKYQNYLLKYIEQNN